tara:strand:- start:34 stop:228 length:195 start_codon:yes stop_codon:yes gene_type:complete
MSIKRIKEIESKLEALKIEIDKPVDYSFKYNPSIIHHEESLQEAFELNFELYKLQEKENQNKDE